MTILSLEMFPVRAFGCTFTTSRLSGEMLASLQYSLMMQFWWPGFDEGSFPDRRWLKAALQELQLIWACFHACLLVMETGGVTVMAAFLAAGSTTLITMELTNLLTVHTQVAGAC